MLFPILYIVLTVLFLCSGAADTSAVTELVRFSNTILTLQFRMATSCDDNVNGGGSSVTLETSGDDGATWQQVMNYLYINALCIISLLSRLFCHVIVIEIFLV